SAASDGRLMLPANTRSVTWFSRSRESPAAAAPMRHQACGTSRTVSGSAAPSRASTKTSRPAARQVSTRRRGRPPPPATIPSLFAICSFGLANGAAGIGADEFDDVVDRADAAEAFRGLVDAFDQSAVRREQELIGIAQRLDIFAAEAAALHADDV